MKTLHYLKKALTLPPHIVLKKIAKKIQKRREQKQKKIVDLKQSTYDLSSSHLHLYSFLNPVDLSKLPRDLIQTYNSKTIHHEFNLLGSGWVGVHHGMQCQGLEGHVYSKQDQREINSKNLEHSLKIRSLIYQPYESIDWHIDFKSGYRWHEDTWFEDIQYGNHLGQDVKVPWELSRLQHLTFLAWGYALEADESYLIEFRNQVLDFIASNPPRWGVNWVCTMDVGIRVANLLFAYDLFLCYGAKFDEDFDRVFARSIYEHAKHIFHHLEWDPHLRSNHYLANISGLLFATSYLPKDPEIQSWLNFSISELKKEVMSQFNPDGSNFEASTCYHRLSAEMVLFSTALALEMGAEFPEEYLGRLKLMAQFTRDITQPDGNILQFGDNDSGRFIQVIPDTNPMDHRYLIKPFSKICNLSSLVEDLLSPEDFEPTSSTCQYPDFGLYIQKNKNCYLGFRCGDIGQKGNGGHSHHDQLSFQLCVGQLPVIIDPGTYVYTPLPEARRHFRSPQMHNTLVPKNWKVPENEPLFSLTNKAKAKIVHFDSQSIIASHRGFGRVYTRELYLKDSSLEGVDKFLDSAKHIYFHLPSEWELQSIDIGKAILTNSGMRVEFESTEGTWDLQQSTYSPGYGLMQISQVLVLYSEEDSIRWRIHIKSSK